MRKIYSKYINHLITISENKGSSWSYTPFLNHTVCIGYICL
jgi:hypothetical protein